MSEPLYIGIAGVAGSGKDTFFSHLKSTLEGQSKKVKRYSFGDCLKEEVTPWTSNHYGIDALTCSRKEKDFIRPMLISHASIRREMSKGQHWINCVEKKIKDDKDTYDVICLTDVRYNFYDNDECSWIKQKGGIIVYVTRFIPKDNCFLEANNEEEKTHDPLVKEASDYSVTIEEKITENEIDSEINFAVESFLSWANKNQKWKT